MAGKARTPAYFAVARAIFDHPLFNYGRPRFSRLEAWEWLIAQAAWKPRGHRHVMGVADLARGQLAITLHEMAAAWGWPVTNTHRFLHRLATEGMVALAHAPAGQSGKETGKETGKGHARSRHVITICNYEQYQTVARKAENRPEKSLAIDRPQLPGIIRETAAEPTITKESIESALATTTRARAKPKHGQRGETRAGLMVWVDHGTQEWDIHALDYEHVRKVAILPKVYDGGRGNWFMVHGEASRRGELRRRSAR